MAIMAMYSTAREPSMNSLAIVRTVSTTMPSTFCISGMLSAHSFSSSPRLNLTTRMIGTALRALMGANGVSPSMKFLVI